MQVLLYVDQTVTSTKLKQPEVDQSRILLTMQRVKGRWLVADLAAV